MRQLDLFDKEPQKKEDSGQNQLKPPVKILVDEPEKKAAPEKKEFVQLIKPLSKDQERPAKRGRKSISTTGGPRVAARSTTIGAAGTAVSPTC